MQQTHGYIFESEEDVDNFARALPVEAYVTGLGDNGGDPGGNAWIVWDLNSDEDALAEQFGGKRATGYEAAYHAEAMREVMDQFLTGQPWSGISCDNIAFFVDETDAKISEATAEYMGLGGELGNVAGAVSSGLPVTDFFYRLHLMETPHGTRYWRWNSEDSDESRSDDHRVTLVTEPDGYESIGQMWMDGASVRECAEAAGDKAAVSEI